MDGDQQRPGPSSWHLLLVRRSSDDRKALAHYVAAGPRRPTLARVAGTRWTIEGAFEAAKQEAGLADYEVWAGPAGTTT